MVTVGTVQGGMLGVPPTAEERNDMARGGERAANPVERSLGSSRARPPRRLRAWIGGGEDREGGGGGMRAIESW